MDKNKPDTELEQINPDKKSVNGRFVTNSTAGTLFVITGNVVNHTKNSCSYVKIRGALIIKDKVEAKDKTIFCGNLIPEEKLETLDMGAIDKALNTKEGSNKSNVDIGAGQSVPFMIVFSDLPENLENFTVNVETFEKENTK